MTDERPEARGPILDGNGETKGTPREAIERDEEEHDAELEEFVATHVWRSQGGDYPCAPTGEENVGPAGRSYARVRYRDGDEIKENYVPGDELLISEAARANGDGNHVSDGGVKSGKQRKRKGKQAATRTPNGAAAGKKEQSRVDPATERAAVERLMALSAFERGLALPSEAEKLGRRYVSRLKGLVRLAEQEQAEIIKLTKNPPRRTGPKSQREPDENGVIWTLNFTMADDGCWYQPPPKDDGEEREPVWISEPVRVLGSTADSIGSAHGILLEWYDDRHNRHTWAVPRKLMHLPGNEIAAQLDHDGLRCNTSPAAHELLKTFLSGIRSTRQIRCVERAGWHGEAYVSPTGQVFGAAPLVMQGAHSVAHETRGARHNRGVEARRCPLCERQ